uniref:Uncharacterized protein n=1 Tax=Romanomermis culicivorax TaxID=13658 RepID=A0A915HYP1_ROMCU
MFVSKPSGEKYKTWVNIPVPYQKARLNIPECARSVDPLKKKRGKIAIEKKLAPEKERISFEKEKFAAKIRLLETLVRYLSHDPAGHLSLDLSRHLVQQWLTVQPENCMTANGL